jgi:5-methylcytosine-specific restriction endonuclease McrA
MPTPGSLDPDGHATSVELFPDAVATPQPKTQLDGTVVNDPNLPPDRVGASPVTSPVARAVVQPLAPGRYKVQFTAGAELRHKLERLRALLRTKVPNGDLAAIIDEAVTETLERLEARRFASTKTPRQGLSKMAASPSSRQIPAAVRRAVYERDGSRCRFVDEQGRRCSERHRLEFHHRHPFALGGDHGHQNIRLLCHAHNVYLAEQDYGKHAMARYRRF